MISALGPEPPLLVIAGPTASGKTALAIALARRLGGEILSADSRQVFRSCDIVTAKPTGQEQAQARHHLIDIAAPPEIFSAAQWAQAARSCITDIRSRGHIPIVCGGTGFYIRALLEPARIDAPVDEVLRADLERQCDESGLAPMHAQLQGLAPERAAIIHPNDRYRVVRALEIALAKPNSQAANTRACGKPPLASIAFRLSWPRADLYARIEARVDAMSGGGAWDELQGLLGSDVARDSPALSGVGYRQMIPALDGEITREEAIALWKQESRRYAKRQATWFSNQLAATPLEAARGAEAMADEVLQVLAASG